MNITKENIDELNAVIKIKLGADDYQPQVNKVLTEHQKRAKMNGFRPGKVPMGLIKKMYGKPVLVDEINKILSDSLYKYLSENKIEVIGSPLPKTDEDSKTDWDNQTEFEFTYEMGLSPQFDVKLQDDKITSYTIKVDDKLIDKYVDYIRKRYGKVDNAEVSEKEDLIYGDFVELDEKENILEGGISKSSTFAINAVGNEEVKKKLIGLKKGDDIVIDPKKLTQNEVDLAALLDIDKEVAGKLKSTFQLTVGNITRMKPAELNQELFDKVYGPGNVNSVENFRNKVSEEASSMMLIESDKKYKSDIIDRLIEKTKISLPNDFLKRWLVKSSEKPVTLDQINDEYDNFARNTKWQLIKSKIIKENGITVSKDEALNEAGQFIRNQYAQYGKTDTDEKEIEDIANKILENEEEGKKVYEKVFDDKVMNLLKNTFKIQEDEVSYDEFVKLASRTSERADEKPSDTGFSKFLKTGFWKK